MDPLQQTYEMMQKFEREFEQLLDGSSAEFVVDCCNSVRRCFFIKYVAQRLNDVQPDAAFRFTVTEPAFMQLWDRLRDMHRRK